MEMTFFWHNREMAKKSAHTTAILAWLFLGEALSPKETIGLVLVGAGVLVVQLRKRP